MRRRARRNNAMYEEKINAYFDAPERRAELVEAISRLVRIRSVREEPLPGMPFGPGPAAALVKCSMAELVVLLTFLRVT